MTDLDPFAEFGGQADPQPTAAAPASDDPFAEFGGQAHDLQATPHDPFAEFGGQADPAAVVGGATQTQSAGSDDGLGSQLARGAANAIAATVDPSGALGLLPKDYYTQHRSGWQMLAEIGTHLAAGHAAATGIGALVGTLVEPGGGTIAGASVGNLLYGLYQGVGHEVSRSEAEGQEFSPLRAATNVALEVNPLIKGGSLISRSVRTVAQAAGQSATEYSYSHDTGSAVAVGALNMVLAYPMIKGMKAVDPNGLPTPDTFQATARALASDTGVDTLKRTAQRVAADTRELDPSDLGFQRFVTDLATQPEADVRQAYRRLTEHYTPDKLQSAWDGYKTSAAFVDSLVDVAHEKAVELGGKVADLDLRQYKDGWKPMEFMSSRLDRLWGGNLEGKVQGVAKAKEAFQVKAVTHFDEATRIDRIARKLGISRTDVGRALDGQLDQLPSTVQTKLTQAALVDRDGNGKVSVLDAWRRLWDDARQEIQSAGYNMGERTNYIPMRSLRGVDLAQAFRDQFTVLQKRALAAGTTIAKLAGDDVDDFRAMAAKVMRKSPGDLTDADFSAAAKAALAQAKTVAVYTPSAVFDRGEQGIGEAFREYDVGKLFTGYINGNLKAVHFDEALKGVRTYITAYRAAGMTNAANYLEQYMADVTGASSRGLVGAMRTAGVTLRDAGRQLQGSDNLAVRGLGHMTEGLPDFLGWANGLVYSSYLGLPNVMAPLRNMLQVPLKTIPEIGYVNGTKWMFQAAWDLTKEMTEAVAAKQNPFKVIEQRLQAEGHIGQHIMANLDVEPGIGNTLRGAADWLNGWSMVLYQHTETMNRALTVKMGQQWAKELATGSKSAFTALNRLPPGFRNELQASGILGGKYTPEVIDKLGHAIGDALIGRTQFRYGKELQSEFGRAMGPLFTMFTKWPTMVAADILEGFGEGKVRGTTALITKNLAPWGLLYAIQAAKDHSGSDPSIAYQLFVGDLPKMTPFDSVLPEAVKAKLTGKPSTGSTFDMVGGPMVQLGKDYIDALSKVGNDNGSFGTGMRTALRQTVKSYIPIFSQAVNEMDRFDQARNPGAATTSRELINRITGGQ